MLQIAIQALTVLRKANFIYSNSKKLHNPLKKFRHFKRRVVKKCSYWVKCTEFYLLGRTAVIWFYSILRALEPSKVFIEINNNIIFLALG